MQGIQKGLIGGLALAGVAWAGVALVAFADQPRSDQSGTGQNAGVQGSDSGLSGNTGVADANQTVIVRKLSDFKGNKVRNQKGEKLGELENVVIDSRTHFIRYGIVSYDRSLGVGQTVFAVPWQALKADIDAKQYDKIGFVLNADTDRVKNAGGFDEKNWPDLADRRWAQTTYQFWNLQPYWERTSRGATIEGTPISPTTQPGGSSGDENFDNNSGHSNPGGNSVQGSAGTSGVGGDANNSNLNAGRTMGLHRGQSLLVRGKDLIGHRVLDMSGKDFAEIKEVMADPNSGRLVYGILQVDKSPDFEKSRLCPVPIEVLSMHSPLAAGRGGIGGPDTNGSGTGSTSGNNTGGDTMRSGVSGNTTGDPNAGGATGSDLTMSRTRRDTFVRDENSFSIVLNVSNDKLQTGPKFSSLNWPMMTMSWGEQIYSHYGVQPFWKSGRSAGGHEGRREQGSSNGGNLDQPDRSTGTHR
jgi:sporulation protein YlmC with PRC-barrel domain